MPASRNVVVVGGGIVGICTGLSLLERGMNVRLVDRDEPGQGASYGNAGVISPWSIVPQSVPGVWRSVPRWLLHRDGPLRISASSLAQFGPWALSFLKNSSRDNASRISDAMEVLCSPCIDLYRRHLAGTGHESLLVDSCYVQVFRNRQDVDTRAFDYCLRKRKGATMHVVDASGLKRLEPALSPDYKAAIVIEGCARARSPGDIARVLAEKLRARGAGLFRCRVRAIEPVSQGGWRVIADGQEFQADIVVLAAGAWSAGLLQRLGIKVPLVGERGYHLEFAEPGVALDNSVLDVERKIIASSMLGGLRVAGTSEFAPLDAPENRARYDSLLRSAKRLIPDLETHAINEWMGTRPSLPDGLPVLGEFATHPGLFGAFGHCHYGLMMAPKSAEIVADLIAGTSSNLDLSHFSPRRFE